MGLVSAFVATYANTKTSAPIYICAVLYIAMVSQRPHSSRILFSFQDVSSNLSCRVIF